jgi:type VI secretion system protein ImpE
MSLKDSEDAFHAGDVSGALAALSAEIRQRPQDVKLRVFLAQLLMVAGQWDRVLTQLQVIGELDAGALAMVHAYRSAIQCERLRTEVFAGRRSPLIFGEPEPWMALQIQALSLDGTQPDQAAAMRSQAMEIAESTAGSANGKDFEWIADADSRLGPVFEVLLNGAYYWVPVHRVASVSIESPADIRDFVWLPATFQWSNGGEAVGMIPVRYPGSENSADSLVRLARKTEWQPLSAEHYAGMGQRILTTGDDEYGLLDLREIKLSASV